MTKPNNENGSSIDESILASINVINVSLNNNAISELANLRAGSFIETYQVDIDSVLEPLSLGDEKAIESLSNHIEMARRNGDTDLVSTLESERKKRSRRWLKPEMREGLIEDFIAKDLDIASVARNEHSKGLISHEQLEERIQISLGCEGSPLANNKHVDVTYKVDGEVKVKRLLSKDGALSSMVKDKLKDSIERVIGNRQARAQNDVQHQLRTEAMVASKHTVVRDYNSFTNYYTNEDGIESCDVNIPLTILNLHKLAVEQKEQLLSNQDTALLT